MSTDTGLVDGGGGSARPVALVSQVFLVGGGDDERSHVASQHFVCRGEMAPFVPYKVEGGVITGVYFDAPVLRPVASAGKREEKCDGSVAPSAQWSQEERLSKRRERPPSYLVAARLMAAALLFAFTLYLLRVFASAG